VNVSAYELGVVLNTHAGGEDLVVRQDEQGPCGEAGALPAVAEYLVQGELAGADLGEFDVAQVEP
jgi:hypothetical protein